MDEYSLRFGKRYTCPAIELPTLPVTNCWGYDKLKAVRVPVLYNAEQMRDYATAAIQESLKLKAGEFCEIQSNRHDNTVICSIVVSNSLDRVQAKDIAIDELVVAATSWRTIGRAAWLKIKAAVFGEPARCMA